MNIDINEALRYLGCNRQDAELTAAARECIAEIEKIMTPKLTYSIYNIKAYEDEVKIKNTAVVLKSRDVARLLRYSDKCVIMAATLGAAVDKRIALYQATEMSKAVVFDACGSAAVEALCETAVQQIKSQEIVKFLTIRFSTGYGDFDIGYQKEMLSLTNSYKKIGVAATSSMVLTPKKSVTAIMGITDFPYMQTRDGCEACSLNKTCSFRKDGRACERL